MDLPKPDSERLSELLPEIVDVMECRQVVIGQEAAMLAMLRVHIDCYSRRLENRRMSELIHPLQEPLCFEDGRMFALTYLAMVERFVEKMNQHLGRDPGAERDLTLMSAIAPILYPGNTPREPLETIRDCLDELRRSRLVFVDTWWHGGQDLERSVMCELAREVEDRWRIDLSKHATLYSMISAIPKPVYLNFYGFGGSDWQGEFMGFLELVASNLASQSGVYFSFRERMPCWKDYGMPTPWGRILRVQLNPLTPMDLQHLVKRSVRRGEPVSVYLLKKHQGMTLDEILTELHQKTDGHTFQVYEALKDEEQIFCSSVKEDHIFPPQYAVKRFPEAIRKYVFDRRYEGDIDLEEVVDLGKGVLGTVGYLASQMHAGIGPYSRSTHITIPASLVTYMEGRFLDLSDYCREAVTRRSNQKTLAEILVRYFQAVFRKRPSWGDAMGDFCPWTCSLWGSRLELDMDSRKDFILRYFARDMKPLQLASQLDYRQVSGRGELHPVPAGSDGPDLFIVRPGYFGGEKIVAVKLVLGPFSDKLVKTEAARYHPIQDGVRVVSWLILFVIGPGLEHYTVARVYKTLELDILIVNLSRPDLRRKFFEPAIPADADSIVSIIEELVARVV